MTTRVRGRLWLGRSVRVWWVGVAEVPHGGVDLLGSLQVAHVARPLDHDELCVRDGLLELAGDGQR